LQRELLSYGHPFDGTWNYQENILNDDVLRKNKFIQIYPSLGSITNFSNNYLGTRIYLSGNYLTSTRGDIYTLNQDLTVKELIYDV